MYIHVRWDLREADAHDISNFQTITNFQGENFVHQFLPINTPQHTFNDVDRNNTEKVDTTNITTLQCFQLIAKILPLSKPHFDSLSTIASISFVVEQMLA